MSERDELASQPALKLDAMAARRWVIFDRRLHPPLYDSVMNVTTPEETFPYVADGSSLPSSRKLEPW